MSKIDDDCVQNLTNLEKKVYSEKVIHVIRHMFSSNTRL